MGVTVDPAWIAHLDQQAVAVDADIDRLGAHLQRLRDEGAHEYEALHDAMLAVEANDLSRADMAMLIVRTADRLYRALAQQPKGPDRG